MASPPIKRRIFILGVFATTGAAGCRDFSDIAGPAPDLDGSVDTNPPSDAGRDTNTPDAPSVDTAPMDTGGVDAGMDTAFTCGGDQLSYVVGTDHGHADGLFFAIDHVTDGMDHTYNIQGASGHPHMIMVTAAQFQMIASGQSVTVTSTVDAGHSHDVTLMCMSA